MSIRSVYVLFLLIAHHETCLGQNSPARLLEVRIPKDLHAYDFASITSITEDYLGYMWFGTSSNGLIRYDGSGASFYSHDAQNANSLSSNQITVVYADAQHRLWIGTNGKGIDLCNLETNEFVHYHGIPSQANSLINDTINSIIKDRRGIIWIGTNGGLDNYDEKTGKFTHYLNKPGDSTSLSDNHVMVIYEDRRGVIWVGTGSPHFRAGGEEDMGGLNRLDLEKGKFTRYLHNARDSQSLSDNRVGAIFEDTRGIFWVGTAGQGLHTMDRDKGIFERHVYDPVHPEKLSRLQPYNTRFSADHITFITEDAAGNIWIGTYRGSLIRFDDRSKEISSFESATSNSDSAFNFKEVSAWRAYNSRDGIFWISCIGEVPLYKVEPQIKPISETSVGYGVSCLYPENDGKVWMGTRNGLIQFDQKSRVIQAFSHDSVKLRSLSSDDITCIRPGRKGNLWLGTRGNGIYGFDKIRSNVTFYHHDSKNVNSLSSDTVSAVYEDQVQNLWIGTSSGLDKMNIITGEFRHFVHNPNDSLSENIILPTVIFEDAQRGLWLGGWGSNGIIPYLGIDRLNAERGKFRHYLHGQLVYSVYEDQEHVLWVGTHAGLFFYDAESDNFLPFVDPGGVEFYPVLNIIGDNQKNLWITSSDEIFKITPNRDQVSSLREYFDIKSNTALANIRNGSIIPGAYKTTDGQMFLLSRSGFFVFYPGLFNNMLKQPKVLLTEFRLGNKVVTPGKNSPISTSIQSVKEISLSYDQNIFSFNFKALDYSNPEADRYIFMLENYDNGWRTAGPERMAYYFNIPPGHYKFRVRAINSKQVWGDSELILTITPPWWRTWWAYASYVFFFIGSVWIFINYRSRQLLREKRALEIKVNLRTSEVNKQKEEIALQRDNLKATLSELKNTQSQLIQREKLASLGELTAGIAHEIQNPLNFVNNFSELNAELIEELKNELATGNRNEAMQIADNIFLNEQKISDHGKRAGNIVKSMLQHSRASTGQKGLVDINAITDEYLRLCYHGLHAKDKSIQVSIKTKFDDGIGKINLNAQDIGRVLLNIYNNAFFAVMEKKKLFGENYEPIISVRTRKANDKIEIGIRDNGTGIAQKDLEKIFQPFYTTKPTGQGTGLGLSLSYDMIKANGGEIKVDTILGEFTEFIIGLPT